MTQSPLHLPAIAMLTLALMAVAGGLRAAEQEGGTMSEPKKPVQAGAQCALPKSDAELRKLLTPEQYRITRQNGTEMPFANAHWDNHRPGLYVDIVSGEALFASTDKFDSGTGWPSFTKPLNPEALVAIDDSSQGLRRTEVRSKTADSHLGHVFDDGPGPTGRRYCINSAALRFIPVEDLAKEGYGQYQALFQP